MWISCSTRVLPTLPAGVLVHIHDIFLPDDYPAEWEWRGYNEQLAAAALLHGGGYRPIWASHYVATRMAEAVAGSAAGSLELVGRGLRDKPVAGEGVEATRYPPAAGRANRTQVGERMPHPLRHARPRAEGPEIP